MEENHPISLEGTQSVYRLSKYNSNHFFYLGIGGQIEVHADFWGQGKYDQHPGGDRTVTLLGYASTPVGGNTIFPALGLTIKPNKGDVLFWITSNNKGDFDTRYGYIVFSQLEFVMY